MRKTPFLLLMIIAIIVNSCIKDTYDMSRLSEKMRINPTLAIAAGYGTVTLSDIVTPNDTLGFDEEDLMKLWIWKDSIIDINLDSLIDFTETFSFRESYPVGNLELGGFSASYNLTLGAISTYFDPALRSQFLALDDGSPHPFPPFPETNTGTHPFISFSNFEYANFAGGSLNIDISNNLNAPVSSIRITFFNADDLSEIGTGIDVPYIDPGSIYSTFIDLTDKRVYKTILAEVIIGESPGTTDPVLIKMTESIGISITGADLRVASGRIIVPTQSLSDPGAEEMVYFDPGDDMEITEFRLDAGTINYTVESELNFLAQLDITLPTVARSGAPFSEIITVNPLSTVTGSYPAANMLALMNTNQSQPYNSFPAEHNITVSSQGMMIDFSSFDSIRFEASITGLEIDYIKGYFGQRSEAFEPDTLDLDIEDIVDRISGEFLISDPTVTLDYYNSFGLPVEISLDATGKRNDQNSGLNLDPFILSYPSYPSSYTEDIFTIDRNNSSLPSLISMPPTSIIFSAGAKLNPAGNTGARDNYVYGDSRFVASLEAMVPIDLWMKNLQFADTLENFMKPDDDDDGFSPEDIEYLRLDLTVTNGFPLGVSVKIVLHDSLTATDLYTLDVPGLTEAAPVNSAGRVTGNTGKVTQIVLEKSFFEAARNADKMIMVFTLNTTGSGSQSVKIYSDYSISFKAGVVVKPDLILN